MLQSRILIPPGCLEPLHHQIGIYTHERATEKICRDRHEPSDGFGVGQRWEPAYQAAHVWRVGAAIVDHVRATARRATGLSGEGAAAGRNGAAIESAVAVVPEHRAGAIRKADVEREGAAGGRDVASAESAVMACPERRAAALGVARFGRVDAAGWSSGAASETAGPACPKHRAGALGAARVGRVGAAGGRGGASADAEDPQSASALVAGARIDPRGSYPTNSPRLFDAGKSNSESAHRAEVAQAAVPRAGARHGDPRGPHPVHHHPADQRRRVVRGRDQYRVSPTQSRLRAPRGRRWIGGAAHAPSAKSGLRTNNWTDRGAVGPFTAAPPPPMQGSCPNAWRRTGGGDHRSDSGMRCP